MLFFIQKNDNSNKKLTLNILNSLPQGMLSALMKIYRQERLGGLWRGATASLPRVGLGGCMWVCVWMGVCVWVGVCGWMCVFGWVCVCVCVCVCECVCIGCVVGYVCVWQDVSDCVIICLCGVWGCHFFFCKWWICFISIFKKFTLPLFLGSAAQLVSYSVAQVVINYFSF